MTLSDLELVFINLKGLVFNFNVETRMRRFMLNSTQSNGFEFLEFISIKETEINHYQPVAGSFAVIKCEGKYLLCYNVWRQQ